MTRRARPAAGRTVQTMTLATLYLTDCRQPWRITWPTIWSTTSPSTITWMKAWPSTESTRWQWTEQKWRQMPTLWIPKNTASTWRLSGATVRERSQMKAWTRRPSKCSSPQSWMRTQPWALKATSTPASWNTAATRMLNRAANPVKKPKKPRKIRSSPSPIRLKWTSWARPEHLWQARNSNWRRRWQATSWSWLTASRLTVATCSPSRDWMTAPISWRRPRSPMDTRASIRSNSQSLRIIRSSGKARQGTRSWPSWPAT